MANAVAVINFWKEKANSKGVTVGLRKKGRKSVRTRNAVSRRRIYHLPSPTQICIANEKNRVPLSLSNTLSIMCGVKNKMDDQEWYISQSEMCPVLHKRIHRVGLNLHVDSKRLPWFPDAQFLLILPECGERILNLARTEAFFEDRKKAKLYCQLVALFSDPLSQDFLRQRFLPHVLKKCRIGDYSLQMDENVINVDNGCEQDLTVTESIHPKCLFFVFRLCIKITNAGDLWV